MSKDEKQKRKHKVTRFRFIKRIWNLIVLSICALFIWLVYCYAIIIFNPYDDQVEEADAVIVLGAALWNDRPSPALRERLDHALFLYNEQKANSIIVSGGRGSVNQKYSEAEGMRNYLIDQGVSQEHIFLEEHSTNTYENLRFTKTIIDKHQFKDVIIVSHSYHAYRTAKIAQFLDIKNAQVSGIDSQVLNKPYHYTREVLAYSKWVINSVTLRLGIYVD